MRLSLPLLLLLAPAVVLAVDPAAPPDAAVKQLGTFKMPAGLRAELFAAEPQLGSPVAISVDDRGRVFVAEEYRLGGGVPENRKNPAFDFSFFLDDDLQTNTLADRLASYRKWEKRVPGGSYGYFTRNADQVRLLTDADGDGKADKSTVFAAGFNDPLDGLAAGVLAHNGDVFFTCIPHLWRLRDTDGDGVADEKTPLLSGFGVNIAFYGHDLHGLIVGPDGKLYFSVGDRGYRVTSKEGKTFSGPRTGAVFRCDPDGANFEVVHTGLRNPQELAFDQHGNLFADDNNCDKGDHARLVYVVEGGDSGWNMAYQSIPAPYMTGPWFAERLWHLPHAGQPAYIVPPVGKIGTGPGGFLFTSGTSLPERYRNSFLMCNYTGNGGLESFRVVPKGAGFEVADYHDFLKPVRATDCEFGPDGKLYVADFVNLDWNGKSLGGRVYTVSDPERLKSPAVQEAKRLFAEGFDKRTAAELAKLLAHPDMKVRQRAQFALAAKKDVTTLAAVAGPPDGDPLARLHAVWGLGQVARSNPDALAPVAALLADADPEVRAQAAKVAGDRGHAASAGKLVGLLADPAPRVRFFAAQSLGRLKHAAAVGPLFALVAETKDADPFLRHAAVVSLARIADADAVAARLVDPSPAVRLAVSLVFRQLGDKRVSQLLTDADPLVRAEAARAVHDLPLESEYPALANRLPALAGDDDAVARRAVSAAYRLGTPDHLRTVLAAVTAPGLSSAVRAEALSAVREWADPPPRDRVTGFWRPLPKRDPAAVRAAVEAALPTLLAKADRGLLPDVVRLVSALGLKTDPATFAGWVADPKREVGARVAALRLLADRKEKGVGDALLTALRDPSPLLRAEARDAFAALDPASGTALLAATLDDPTAATVERQRATAALAGLKTPAAAAALNRLADRLAAGTLPPELQLDAWDALWAARTPARDALRAKFEAALPADPVGKFRVSLTGGDADRGRDIFFGHAAAQCVRCHQVKGVGGTAGPDLSKVASRYPDKTRDFFLESLVLPSAKIAPGFAAVSLTTVDGRVVAGTLLADDGKAVTVQTPDGKKVIVPTDDIDARTVPTSPMPAVDRTLTHREMRDLIEYLTTLRE